MASFPNPVPVTWNTMPLTLPVQFIVTVKPTWVLLAVTELLVMVNPVLLLTVTPSFVVNVKGLNRNLDVPKVPAVAAAGKPQLVLALMNTHEEGAVALTVVLNLAV